jgi:hypothetical protein
MQRNEAAAVLGLDENATAAQARDRAKQLEGELSQKIGRAPTPSLRSSYQKSLQQIGEAARAFGGDSGSAGAVDLPSSEPRPSDPAEPTSGPISGVSSGVAEPPKKKSNTGKVAAVAGAAAIVGLATAATFAHPAEVKPEEGGHHHEHDHDDDPPPSSGIEDGLLSAVLEELATVNVEDIAAEATPSLDSWMVIDDPNPPELAPPEPVHHEVSLFDALEAAATHVQPEQALSIDIVRGDGVDILNLTASADTTSHDDHSRDHHRADDDDDQ